MMSWMKKFSMACLILAAAASARAGNSAAPAKVHWPYFLTAQDKVPRKSLACPDVPSQGPGGEDWDAQASITPPDRAVLDQFSSPALFEDIQRQKTPETKIQHPYWHTASGGLDYCHFQDLEGNHWYGWSGGDGNFNWVLWKGHRFWWRDTFASHWLYYFQGYWWRSDGQAPHSIQVCIGGEYYACDGQGNLLKDMGQDGSGDIISAPGRYQGDRHGGHGGGGHGGHGGQGAPSGGQAAPAAGSAPSGN